MQIRVHSSQLSLDFDSDVRPTIELHFEHAKLGQALLAALVHQKSKDYSRLGGRNKVQASEATYLG